MNDYSLFAKSRQRFFYRTREINFVQNMKNYFFRRISPYNSLFFGYISPYNSRSNAIKKLHGSSAIN